MNRIFIGMCFITLAACGGCGGSGMLPISGTVKFQDGSIPQGEIASILFTPVVTGEKARPASGDINKDGTFQMMTEVPGDGVLPGEYKVVFNVWKTYVGRETLVETKFTSASTTPITAKVGPGEKSKLEFVIEKAP